jgi:hypothetical protein
MCMVASSLKWPAKATCGLRTDWSRESGFGLTTLLFPQRFQPNEIATYLDDLFHEGAAPGTSVRLLAQ